MINLRVRTEYSFLKAYGKLDDVIARGKEIGANAMAITDSGTWGHIPFFNKCKAAGIKPILGMEFLFVPDVTEKAKGGSTIVVLALNNDGLKSLYQIASEATKHMYYVKNRIDMPMLRQLRDCVILLDRNNVPPTKWKRLKCDVYTMITPSNHLWSKTYDKLPYIVCGDNYYPSPSDSDIYKILSSIGHRGRDSISHRVAWIPDKYDIANDVVWIPDSAFSNITVVADMVDVTLPEANMVTYKGKATIESTCRAGAKRKGVDLSKGPYKERYQKELAMIKKKSYVNYFLVVSDLCTYAKKHMLVGPSRGSSAGSLICYLMDITEIDPLKHNLIFERFIDTTRTDLPDIDIDFPDNKRDIVFQYLKDKYGAENVSNIGTISRFKPKSAIGDVSKILGIPFEDTQMVKDAIVERSGGDARANFCVMDTFNDLDVGKEFIRKYPQMRIVENIEAHARHTGKHAAGVFICNEEITNYCSVDYSGDYPIAMLDKKDAEKVNLLKIDILGLRTLAVIDDCIDQVGLSRKDVYNLPLTDKKAYELINKKRYSGIFQFEGYALKSISSQMSVSNFQDITSITALARPGPLHSGGTTEFVNRHIGAKPITYQHPAVEPYVKDYYGIIIYQEQVMMLSREVGRLSWEDTDTLRRAMAKSLGDEFFGKYEKKFIKGAAESGVDKDSAKAIWDAMCTFGSWAFNLSHAVSYAMISYWCMYLKANYPLEFAAATLRHSKSPDQSVKMLRDIVQEGIEFVPFDAELSEKNWSVKDGKLVGGLLGAKGIGEKTADDIIRRREAGEKLTNSQRNILSDPDVPWKMIFEGRDRFGDYYNNPEAYNIKSGDVSYITDMEEEGEYVFLGKLTQKNQRDLNETQSLVRRGGRKILSKNLFLNITVEDDTDSIICTIDRFKYDKMGKPIVEERKIGDWFLIKGVINDANFRRINIIKIKHIGDAL